MEKLTPIQQLLRRSRRLPLLVGGLTLLILAGTILVARQQLRTKVREQLIGRDGAVLHAVAQRHFDELLADAASPDLAQQLTVVLKTSRLGGVMGARLFDTRGRFMEAFDADVLDTDLNPVDLPSLQQLRPVSRFHRSIRLAENFWVRDKAANVAVPMLEVNVPLHSRQGRTLLGIAQFLIEGQSIVEEFAQLDRNLTREAIAAFGVSSAVLILALGWAFRHSRRAQELLATRTGELLQANQELALAAKTSAVGAVSAHLIHGLKNPLSGLQNFVSNSGPGESARAGEEWEQAVASTRRMQSMINDVVNVLREEEDGAHYELSLVEMANLIQARVLPLARDIGVALAIRQDAQAVLPNRIANLVALILVNLAQNALEATPPGKSVSLQLASDSNHLLFEVRDQGPGLPEHLRQNPFAPCRSNKGGSGIGLAISKQLANHLGAVLELRSSTVDGCVFVLALPLKSLQPLQPGADKIQMAVSPRK